MVNNAVESALCMAASSAYLPLNRFRGGWQLSGVGPLLWPRGPSPFRRILSSRCIDRYAPVGERLEARCERSRTSLARCPGSQVVAPGSGRGSAPRAGGTGGGPAGGLTMVVRRHKYYKTCISAARWRSGRTHCRRSHLHPDPACLSPEKASLQGTPPSIGCEQRE